MDKHSDKPFVVLIHGLHQNAWTMYPLAKFFRQHGFITHQHNYRSLKDDIDKHSDRLNEWLIRNHSPQKPIHLVGHSLGGLVIRNFIHRYPNWQIANCVTLGTPHLGSITADYGKRLIAPLIGGAYNKALDGQALPLQENIKLGVIAGNVPRGLGQLVLNYHSKKSKHSEHERSLDGTVYIAETKLPEAADHITMPVSHTGLLVNKEVAKQTLYFLKNGHFNHNQ